ncbi:MAG: D-TA family PLP-dependent enzyme [Anaerolineae bacterium]
MNIYDLETPAVLIDLERMERNIQRMQAHCNSLGLAFRPHIKTHKIPEIARMQLDAGAVGIACQKISEAEVFAQAGFNDIQIPYNIVGAAKTRRLVDLVLYNRVTVAADHLLVISGLAEAAKKEDLAIRVMLELGTDAERTGAQPDQMVEFAKRIDVDENLHFAGLIVYPSNPSVRPALQETLSLLHHAGIGVDTVSGGGTGAARLAKEVPELTELRVGTYVFNDWTCVMRKWADMDDCAMVVAATVVSHPTADRVILDSGSKTLAADTIDGGHGFIMEYPDAYIYKLNEEHAYVDMSRCTTRPVIGDRVHVIPVHACVVMNLHDRIYGYRGEQVEVEWTTAARGKVQ